MTKKIFISIALMSLCSQISAQNNLIFYGGIGDGISKNNYTSLYSNITNGGVGNGNSSGNYLSLFQDIRKGGVGEGSNALAYISAYAEIRLGALGDGVASNNYTSTYNDPRIGGQGDGVASNNYVSAYNEIRLGSVGDGYASITVPSLPLNPLPLNLISFTGARVNYEHQLQWSTAFEKDMSHFIVERSANGFSWQAISKEILVHGNVTNEYNYIDNAILNGANYYRLRMYDNKGKFTFSNIVLLNNISDYQVALYPNPTAELLNINHNLTGNISIQVLNLNGQVLMEQFSQMQNVQLNLSALAPANYFVRISNKQKQFLYKIVKR
jgi:hypothetical protein